MKRKNVPLLTSFEDHLDQQHGKRGTPSREEFERGFETFVQEEFLTGKVTIEILPVNISEETK
jgi:hypothetical protein